MSTIQRACLYVSVGLVVVAVLRVRFVLTGEFAVTTRIAFAVSGLISAAVLITWVLDRNRKKQ